MIQQILLLVIALALTSLTGVGVWMTLSNRHHYRAAMIALEGVGETHKLGFEALLIDLDRLRTRVEALELRTGLGSRVDNVGHNR